MTDLSILIPSRNEPYLYKTIEDVLKHAEGDIEIIYGWDAWDRNLDVLVDLEKLRHELYKIHGFEKVREVFVEKKSGFIGQRALTNKLANIAKGKYLMKLDAHCSLSQGFDRKMVEAMEDNMVMTGLNCILDVEGWTIRPKPFTTKYYFDEDLVFQNYNDFPRGEGKLVETMTIPGSMFMISKENYHRLNLCDEAFGSWGFQGVETSCKMWLSGGRVVTNTDVFYGHMFRTKNLPYERKMEDVLKAQSYAKEQFIEGKFKGIKPLSWLIDKFNPPGWSKQMLEYIHKT